jgi:hypothetical protein
VNSNVSKQWLFDKYAMNAASVHGASAVFERISLRFGLRKQYDPCTAEDVGIATESGLVGDVSSFDMEKASTSVSVSSAAEAENTDGGYFEDLVEVDVVSSEKSDDGFRTTITLRKRVLWMRARRVEGRSRTL